MMKFCDAKYDDAIHMTSRDARHSAAQHFFLSKLEAGTTTILNLLGFLHHDNKFTATTCGQRGLPFHEY